MTCNGGEMKEITACLLWFIFGLFLTKMYWPSTVTEYRKYVVLVGKDGYFVEPVMMEKGDIIQMPMTSTVTRIFKS
jgi:hypothetical protein